MKSPIFLPLLDASLFGKVIILAASAHRTDGRGGGKSGNLRSRVLESDEGEM